MYVVERINLDVILSLDFLFAGENHKCQCEKNDAVWRFDEGVITDDSSVITDDSRLPVQSLFFIDTDAANEMGYFTLGPLICY